MVESRYLWNAHMICRGRIEPMDRTFDIQFRQARPPEARFRAAREMVLHVARVQGLEADQLPMQRSLATFGRRPWRVSIQSDHPQP